MGAPAIRSLPPVWSWLLVGLAWAAVRSWLDAPVQSGLLPPVFAAWYWPAIALPAAWMVSVLLWEWSGSRRRWVLGTLFACWAILPVIGLLIEAERVESERIEAKQNALVEARQGLRRQEAIRAQKELEWIERERSEKKDRYARYAGRISRSHLEKIRLLDQRMSGRLDEARTRYREAFRQQNIPGPETWLRAEEKSTLAGIREKYLELYEAGRELTRLIDSFESDYLAAIEEAALPEAARRVAVAELQRILSYWEYGGDLEIRELDSAIVKEALRAQEILLEQWGAWQRDPVSGEVSFESQGAERDFFNALRKMEEYAAEIQKILEKNREKSRSGS